MSFVLAKIGTSSGAAAFENQTSYDVTFTLDGGQAVVENDTFRAGQFLLQCVLNDDSSSGVTPPAGWTAMGRWNPTTSPFWVEWFYKVTTTETGTSAVHTWTSDQSADWLVPPGLVIGGWDNNALVGTVLTFSEMKSLYSPDGANEYSRLSSNGVSPRTASMPNTTATELFTTTVTEGGFYYGVVSITTAIAAANHALTQTGGFTNLAQVDRNFAAGVFDASARMFHNGPAGSNWTAGQAPTISAFGGTASWTGGGSQRVFMQTGFIGLAHAAIPAAAENQVESQLVARRKRVTLAELPYTVDSGMWKP
jgi:hypothetical protein